MVISMIQAMLSDVLLSIHQPTSVPTWYLSEMNMNLCLNIFVLVHRATSHYLQASPSEEAAI